MNTPSVVVVVHGGGPKKRNGFGYALRRYHGWMGHEQLLDQKVAKRQAAGSEALLAKATLLISKLTLKNELEVRELQSAVFRTLTLDVSPDFIVKVRSCFTKG